MLCICAYTESHRDKPTRDNISRKSQSKNVTREVGEWEEGDGTPDTEINQRGIISQGRVTGGGEGKREEMEESMRRCDATVATPTEPQQVPPLK